MIFDAQLLFMDNQDLTGSGGLSENIIDMDLIEPGRGEGIQIYTLITTAIIGDAPFVELDLGLAEANNLDMSDYDGTLLAQTSIPKADLIIGYQFRLSCVPVENLKKRYLALSFSPTQGVGAISAGNMTAGLILTRQSN